MTKEEVLTRQYEKMIDVGLHYDQKLWLIPGAAYTISAVFYNVILSSSVMPFARAAIASLNSLIFFGFLIQFIKDRAFQLGNQQAVNEIKNQIGMASVSEFAGAQPFSSRDRWFIRLTRNWSAANSVVYVMLLTLSFHITVAVFFLFKCFFSRDIGHLIVRETAALFVETLYPMQPIQ